MSMIVDYLKKLVLKKFYDFKSRRSKLHGFDYCSKIISKR